MRYLREVSSARFLSVLWAVVGSAAAGFLVPGRAQVCGWGDYYSVLAVEWVHPVTGKRVRGVDAVVCDAEGRTQARAEVKVRRKELPGLGRRKSALVRTDLARKGAYFRLVHRGDTLLYPVPVGELVHVCQSGFLDRRDRWKPTDDRPRNALNRPFGVVRIPVPVRGTLPPTPPAPPADPPAIVEAPHAPASMPAGSALRAESGWERFAIFPAADSTVRIRADFRFRNVSEQPFKVQKFSVWPQGFAPHGSGTVAPGGWGEVGMAARLLSPPGWIRYHEVTGSLWTSNGEYASPVLRAFVVGAGTAAGEGVWRGRAGGDSRLHELRKSAAGASFGPLGVDGVPEGRWMRFDAHFRPIADTVYAEPLTPSGRMYAITWNSEVLLRAGLTPEQAMQALRRRHPAVEQTMLSGRHMIDLTNVPDPIAVQVLGDLAASVGIARLARVYYIKETSVLGWLVGDIDIRCVPGTTAVECLQCMEETKLFASVSVQAAEHGAGPLVRAQLSGNVLDTPVFRALYELTRLACVSSVVPVNGFNLRP